MTRKVPGGDRCSYQWRQRFARQAEGVTGGKEKARRRMIVRTGYI